MFRNYFLTAWRNLIRNKLYSGINIFGLALGIACSMLIMLWVQDERSVDAFHKNNKYLFQVYERNYFDGKVDAGYPTQGLLAEELKKTIPEIAAAAGFESASAPGSLNNFEANGKVIKMQGNYAGEDFFDMFSFPLIQGTEHSALRQPGAIAISKKMAEAFFGDAAHAMERTIRIDNHADLRISAVFDNISSRSSLQFDFVRPWVDFVKENDWVHNWSNTDPQTFVQLRKDADPVKTEAKLKDFIYRYGQKDKSFIVELGLQPFPEKYLHSAFKNGKIDGGRIGYVRLFSVVCIFILLIACINFMNLSIAQSSKRAKEIGIRKAAGAIRAVLIRQFIGEAFLLTFLAVIIALIMISACIPAFNQLTGKQIIIPASSPGFWITVTGITLVVGIVSGSYPAFYLSSLNAAKVLKGNLKFSWGNLLIGKGLVVFQFTLSTILVVGMVVIYRQWQFIQTKNIGYDRVNLLYIPIEGELTNNYEVFKEEALRLPEILGISKMRNSPTVIEHHNGSISWPGKAPDLNLSFADAIVGYDFVKTMKLQMKAGRDFSKEFSSDSVSFLINETAADKIGFKHPLGKTMIWGKHPGKIIGVLKDFHFNSLHQNIEPLIVRLDEHWPWGTILIRIKQGKTKQAVDGLSKLCRTLNPKTPFTYRFSDLEFDKLYKSELMASRLSDYFAVIAIMVSCLGLFALTTFTAAQRTKEIGVRKVLGAGVTDIFILLSGNLLQLVFIALLISFPLAWYAMNQWLQNFAYKISMGWMVFGIAGTGMIGVALLTVSVQGIKAAVANPIKSLRTE